MPKPVQIADLIRKYKDQGAGALTAAELAQMQKLHRLIRGKANRNDRENQRLKEKVAFGRDVAGDYPPPGNRELYEACRDNLQLFLVSYFPAAFPLPFCADHIQYISTLQNLILTGGMLALAMPRGSGKSTIAERASLWATLYGHRKFVCVIGATQDDAGKILESIKTELAWNETLLRDFRTVVYPIARLENNGRRVIGQLFDQKPTRIIWKADLLGFPVLPSSARESWEIDAGGACISVRGITGAIRGQKTTLPDGTVNRPDFFLIDDPQTRESAASPTQCADRLAVINGDVLKLAGPRVQMSGLTTCTVIYKDDLADQLLDRQRNPRWQGTRFKFLYAEPTRKDLWEKYATLRQDSFRAGTNGKPATDFYAEHKADMDEGAAVAWAERYESHELSAIQHAMNLRIDDEVSFAAEYQNEPLDAHVASEFPDAEAIRTKVNNIPAGTLPIWVEFVTVHIDVHDGALFYTACGFGSNFSGAVVEHSVWPRQNRLNFTLSKLVVSLQDTYRNAGIEGAIRAGLMELVGQLAPRRWKRQDGIEVATTRILIDAGYKPRVVEDVCRNSPHAALLLPSRGVGITAAHMPMGDYQRRPGDRHGDNWYMPKPEQGQIRSIRFDSNHWKTFVAERLGLAIGDPGALSLYGDKPEDHRLFADHLTAETPIRTEGRGRTVWVWKTQPSKPDNHWLDNVVGCAVGASLSGAQVPGTGATSAGAKKRVSALELQRAARGSR